ncbi:hypothetical protein CR513_50510, partial [Mucuna pruriens]
MARPATTLLPLLASIVVIILLLESEYVEAVGEEGSAMDFDALMKKSDPMSHDVYCCYDNHIGSCKPGTWDDHRCNDLCIKAKNSCEKGGRCKEYAKKYQYCHCFC